jgi:hypothetical protein
MMGSMRQRQYIRASEVGTFLYCRRAWHLSQGGAPSLLEAERARGRAFHLQHGRRVRAAVPAQRLARWCGAAALLLFALGLVLALS